MSLDQIKIEKEAEKIRNSISGKFYGISEIFKSAELLDFKVFRYPIGENSVLGIALVRRGEKVIFTNSSAILAREIFSTAHEIGHLILHLDEKTNPAILDKDFSGENLVEKEANYFAACLLMPAEMLKKYIRLTLKKTSGDDLNGLDIARIQTVFYVSYDMVLIRLKELSIISLAKYEELRVEKLEKTATGLLKAINGNIELSTPSNAKKAPAEFLEYAIHNYNDYLIPFKSLKKVFDFFELDTTFFKKEKTTEEDEESLCDILGRMEE